MRLTHTNGTEQYTDASLKSFSQNKALWVGSRLVVWPGSARIGGGLQACRVRMPREHRQRNGRTGGVCWWDAVQGKAARQHLPPCRVPFSASKGGAPGLRFYEFTRKEKPRAGACSHGFWVPKLSLFNTYQTWPLQRLNLFPGSLGREVANIRLTES